MCMSWECAVFSCCVSFHLDFFTCFLSYYYCDARAEFSIWQMESGFTLHISSYQELQVLICRSKMMMFPILWLWSIHRAAHFVESALLPWPTGSQLCMLSGTHFCSEMPFVFYHENCFIHSEGSIVKCQHYQGPQQLIEHPRTSQFLHGKDMNRDREWKCIGLRISYLLQKSQSPWAPKLDGTKAPDILTDGEIVLSILKME